jgi:hypothetical protein
VVDVGSARLDGMGGLLLAVPDESEELNLSDYGRNITGLLQDTDGRRAEMWYRSMDHVVDDHDAGGLRTRTRNETVESGTELSWRKVGERVIGVSYAFSLFRYSYERGDRGQLRGPEWGAYAVQKAGPLFLGVAVDRPADNENLTTVNSFGTTHDGTGHRYTGSAGYYHGPFDVGVQYERFESEILGSGHDESRFHEDEFTWRRPQDTVSGSVIWQATEMIRGAVLGRFSSINGREEVEVSWSDRMPDNPGRTNFRTRIGTFKEELRTRTVGTRWEADPAEAIHIAAELENGSHTDEVVEGVNFKGTRRAQDVEQSWNRVGLGAGWSSPAQRLRLGVEGWYSMVSTDRREAAGVTTVDSYLAEARLGAEYFIKSSVALRAGYSRMSEDADKDKGLSLSAGNAFTLGAGYLPRGGLVQIDAALRFEDWQPDYDLDPSQESSRIRFSSSLRVLL